MLLQVLLHFLPALSLRSEFWRCKEHRFKNRSLSIDRGKEDMQTPTMSWVFGGPYSNLKGLKLENAGCKGFQMLGLSCGLDNEGR